MDPEHPSLPAGIAQSWRLWLLTGARRGPVDRRRLRGSHLGIKRTLLEDSSVRGEPAYGWKEFSDAMYRHAIGDAIETLPDRDEQVLKLAYFGGFSNRDIAAEFGLSEAAVASRLRRALDAISERIQRGGATMRRAAFAVAAWFCGRWCEGWIHRAVEVSAVAAVAVVVTAAAPGGTGPRAPQQPAAPAQTQTVRSEVTSAAQRDSVAGPDSPVPAPSAPSAESPVAPVLPVTATLPSAPSIAVAVPQVAVPQVAVPPVSVPAPPPVRLPAPPVHVTLRA